MENLPVYISLGFLFAALLTVFFLYKASRGSNKLLLIIFCWMIIQSIAGLAGFYSTQPFPRFALLVAPPLLAIILLFVTPTGRTVIDAVDPKWLTWLHIVRIPVELVLLGLFTYGKVPKLMTFEGRNFDVLSGISAPLIVYFFFVKRSLGRKLFIAWNIICLCLLLNIVANAILSAPSPSQQFAFDQPNVAIFYFPFVLLPGFIVPAVLFSHLVLIRQAIRNMNTPSI